jgi:hypothetical protein
MGSASVAGNIGIKTSNGASYTVKESLRPMRITSAWATWGTWSFPAGIGRCRLRYPAPVLRRGRPPHRSHHGEDQHPTGGLPLLQTPTGREPGPAKETCRVLRAGQLLGIDWRRPILFSSGKSYAHPTMARNMFLFCISDGR